MIIQLRIVERDLATLIGLNDYETLRLVEVLRRSRTLLLYQGQLKPLTASELCQHHCPWRPFWPHGYPQVFGESIGKLDGELHLYTSNNVIPNKTALREIPLCVLKKQFCCWIKRPPTARYTWESDWAHWMGKCSYSCELHTFCLLIIHKLAMLTIVFSLAFIKTACTIRCRKPLTDNLLGGWTPLASV